MWNFLPFCFTHTFLCETFYCFVSHILFVWNFLLFCFTYAFLCETFYYFISHTLFCVKLFVVLFHTRSFLCETFHCFVSHIFFCVNISSFCFTYILLCETFHCFVSHIDKKRVGLSSHYLLFFFILYSCVVAVSVSSGCFSSIL